MEQRPRRAAPGARRPDASGAMKARNDERGLATLETTFAITILVPLLFSVLEFGSALERWLAQDAATVQAARYAGELGGDAPELRHFLDEELRAAGIDPQVVSVDVAPSRVGWRQPVSVSVSFASPVSIPCIVTT